MWKLTVGDNYSGEMQKNKLQEVALIKKWNV